MAYIGKWKYMWVYVLEYSALIFFFLTTMKLYYSLWWRAFNRRKGLEENENSSFCFYLEKTECGTYTSLLLSVFNNFKNGFPYHRFLHFWRITLFSIPNIFVAIVVGLSMLLKCWFGTLTKELHRKLIPHIFIGVQKEHRQWTSRVQNNIRYNCLKCFCR